ncbi:hypothetical protein FM106_03970 [Brachybacterium faecium]|nr:hypothetical protein FM106_03970 [Brachybacterium faecium]
MFFHRESPLCIVISLFTHIVIRSTPLYKDYYYNSTRYIVI